MKDEWKKSVKYTLVTKLVRRKDWEEYYNLNSSYTLLSDPGRYGDMRIGFLIAGKIPPNCEIAEGYELQKIIQHRKENNVYPIGE